MGEQHGHAGGLQGPDHAAAGVPPAQHQHPADGRGGVDSVSWHQYICITVSSPSRDHLLVRAQSVVRRHARVPALTPGRPLHRSRSGGPPGPPAPNPVRPAAVMARPGAGASSALLIAAVLVLLAALIAPEQPRFQEAICQRHNGVAACRVW